MSMPWKLAIFDWDGTLVSSQEMAYHCSTAVILHFGGKPSTKEEYLEECDSDFLKYYQKRGVSTEVTRAQLNAVWREKMKLSTSRVNLREGSREVLTRCKKRDLTVAIVSASASEVIRETAEALGILNLIDHIYADACGKTSELRQSIACVGVSRPQAFYVDDTHEGISAANQVGVTSVAISGGFNSINRLRAADPDHLIDSLLELPEKLKL